MVNVWLKIETKMEMNEYSLSCVKCLSWNLLFLTPCPRLICLEQNSLRICTKEHGVSSPSRKLLNTFTMSIKSKAGMSVQASCSFHFLRNTFRRNEGEKKKKREGEISRPAGKL